MLQKMPFLKTGIFYPLTSVFFAAKLLSAEIIVHEMIRRKT